MCTRCLRTCLNAGSGVRLFMSAHTFSHSVSTLVWKRKDRTILLAACLAPFPLSLCHSGSASEPLTEMLWRLLCHIGGAAGRLTDGQDRQEVQAGGWVTTKLKERGLWICLCAHYKAQPRRCAAMWRCSGCECARTLGEEEGGAFSYSCLLASIVCSSEASCCLDHAGASASVSKREKENKSLWHSQGLSRGVDVQAQRRWSISNNTLLMSSWSSRKAGGGVLCVGKQQSYQPSHGFMCYSFRQGARSANFVCQEKKKKKVFLNLMTPTVYIKFWRGIKESHLKRP